MRCRFFITLGILGVLASSCVLPRAKASLLPTAANLAPVITQPASETALPAVDHTLAPTEIGPSPGYWPTDGWRTSTPEEQGMDGEELAQMVEDINRQGLNLHSLLIVRNGYLVSETYFQTFEAGQTHELYSCTKSFIATLVGIAIDQGYISRIDQKVLDFFPGKAFENLDARKKNMTLDNLLTMTSGLDWVESDSAYRELYFSNDWVKDVLDMPMREAPGSRFNYCSGCSHLLSAIVQGQTGLNTRDFADKNLFQPLGIRNYTWDSDRTGIPIGGWGLKLTSRDMAKLGFLYLHQGAWDGKQLVSAQWIETATQKHVETDDGQLGYGYQWWIYPSLEAYTALGRYGQMIFVIPSLNLVIVTTADLESHDEIFQLIEQRIVPSIR